MHPDKEKQLLDSFPELYNPDLSPEQSITCFGFDCGDGWFDIIENLSSQLYSLKMKPVILQVKEKFGSLRVYVDWENPTIREYINQAEEKASVTCSICGKPGKLKSDSYGWLTTICEECESKKFLV